MSAEESNTKLFGGMFTGRIAKGAVNTKVTKDENEIESKSSIFKIESSLSESQMKQLSGSMARHVFPSETTANFKSINFGNFDIGPCRMRVHYADKSEVVVNEAVSVGNVTVKSTDAGIVTVMACEAPFVEVYHEKLISLSNDDVDMSLEKIQTEMNLEGGDDENTDS